MKLSKTKAFLPKRSSFILLLRFLLFYQVIERDSNLLVVIGYTGHTSTSLNFRSYTKIWRLVEAKSHPYSLILKRCLSMLLNKHLSILLWETTQTLLSLSWLWGKRFVPGIIHFMSLMASLISQNKNLLYFFFFGTLLHEDLYDFPKLLFVALMVIISYAVSLLRRCWSYML